MSSMVAVVAASRHVALVDIQGWAVDEYPAMGTPERLRDLLNEQFAGAGIASPGLIHRRACGSHMAWSRSAFASTVALFVRSGSPGRLGSCSTCWSTVVATQDGECSMSTVTLSTANDGRSGVASIAAVDFMPGRPGSEAAALRM